MMQAGQQRAGAGPEGHACFPVGRSCGWATIGKFLAWSAVCGWVAAAAQEAPKAVPVPEERSEAPVAGAGRLPEPEAEANAPAAVTVSRTKQFVVRGGGLAERGAVAVLAEDTKQDLLRLLDAKDEWKVPVVVELHGKPGDPRPPRTVVPGLFATDQGWRLQLDVHLARGVENDRFEHAVLSMLAYEWTLRALPPEASGQRLLVRPWLVEGLREAIRWRAKRGDRRAYQSLYKSGGLFGLEEMFGLGERQFDELDAASREAFRVSAGSMVLALLEQPDGRAAFRKMLGEAAKFEGEVPILLRRHFPDLNLSERSLAKWWALQMANMAEAPLTDVLTVAETEAALAAAVRLSVRDADGMMSFQPLERHAMLAGLTNAERAEAVRAAEDALVRLSFRCFPSYRPLVADYQEILQDLATAKGRKLDERLAELAAIRERMSVRAARARDYLDWFEITRAREASGEFDDYLRVKEQLQQSRHGGDDPVSRYLDDLQKAFAR